MAIDPRTGRQLTPPYGPQVPAAGDLSGVDPADALSEFFGGRSAQDPVTQLAGLRHDRERALQVGGNGEGNVPQQLDTLHSQMANDPFTGTAETARVAGVQHALDVANTEQLDPVKQQRQEEEQFTMDKLLKPIQAQGANSLAVEKQKADAARDVASTRADALQGVADTKARQGTPLTNDEKNVMDKVNQAKELIPQLLTALEQENPGMDPSNVDAHKGWQASAGGVVHGFMQAGGLPQSKNRSLIGDTLGLLHESLPRLVVNSVRSKALLDELKKHVPSPYFSDAENYARLLWMRDNAMVATEHGIAATHGQPPAAAPAYNPNDPSTWQREQ